MYVGIRHRVSWLVGVCQNNRELIRNLLSVTIVLRSASTQVPRLGAGCGATAACDLWDTVVSVIYGTTVQSYICLRKPSNELICFLPEGISTTTTERTRHIFLSASLSAEFLNSPWFSFKFSCANWIQQNKWKFEFLECISFRCAFMIYWCFEQAKQSINNSPQHDEKQHDLV